MLIAINTQALIRNKLEGIGWFTFEIISRITRNHPEHQFLFIFDRTWDPEFIFSPNVIPINTILPSRHPFLWYYRFQYVIPEILKKYKPQLFLSTDGYIPLHPKVKTYNIIHDIGFVHNRKIQPWLISQYYNYFFPKYAQNAHRLGTVSDYSKTDLVETLKIDPAKIDIIYNGCNLAYYPANVGEKEKVESLYTKGCPYFIYVGSLNPRKNIEGMLRGFERFKESNQNNFKLVVLGEPMWNQAGINRTLSSMNHKEDVIFIGRKQPQELRSLIACSRSLVLVSHLEGFGIPILEAMNCDIPSICSNITSMPEVAGNAGIFVNPYSDDSIAMGFQQMAYDQELYQKLILNGRIQRKKFSWDQSANNLWTGLEICMMS
jgi:glycosyltransferase involved in cell wall biosynthesis